MTPTELAAILEDHRLWLAGEGGHRADLKGANLENADLRGADLAGADLRDANLGGAYLGGAYLANASLGGADLAGANLVGATLGGANLGGAYLRDANLRYSYLGRCYLAGAYLRDANLDEARGLVWARSGPCGIGPRQILGWWTPAEGLVIEAGCFRGSPAEMRTRVADGGWDWPSADHDRLAASVERHLCRVEEDVHEWLAACDGAA